MLGRHPVLVASSSTRHYSAFSSSLVRTIATMHVSSPPPSDAFGILAVVQVTSVASFAKEPPLSSLPHFPKACLQNGPRRHFKDMVRLIFPSHASRNTQFHPCRFRSKIDPLRTMHLVYVFERCQSSECLSLLCRVEVLKMVFGNKSRDG